ncbi:MAG TPA: aldo/keto reductase [Clostridia bacterium]
MEKTRLGRTELMVTRCGFGALPVQRADMDTAISILKKAYNSGINFFDTARAYSDSEEKIGRALSSVRGNIIIASKTGAKDGKTLLEHFNTSIEKLNTDYIDIYQFHNPDKMPVPGGEDGLYDAALKLRESGKIKFISISAHKLDIAVSAVESGLYDTLQYPINYLSTKDELKLIDKCREHDVGLIAMKALSGGLITNISASFAFLYQYPEVVPIWGIQRETELDQFIELYENPPKLDDAMLLDIEKDIKELSGEFCRGCGYCLPCAASIYIPMAARMSFLLRRAPYQGFLTDEWKKQMELITKCTECGQCKKRCPYELDTPKLLKTMYEDYIEFYRTHS